jgi:hypothetical protein
MAITEAFANTQSVTATEHSLPRDATYSSASPQTDDGVYQCFLDVNAIAFGDEFQFRVYEKVQSTDTQRIVYEAIIAGPQSTPIFVTPSLVLLHGWDMTLLKLAGTDRTITWSIRKVA